MNKSVFLFSVWLVSMFGVVACMVAAAFATSFAPTTSGAMNWSNSAAWTPNGVPGVSGSGGSIVDTVSISNSAVVTLDISPSLSTITGTDAQSYVTLTTGAQTITATGGITYSGSSYTNGLIHNGGGVLTLAGSNNSLSLLTNSGSGYCLTMSSGTSILNVTSGTALTQSSTTATGYGAYLSGGSLGINVTGANVAILQTGTNAGAYGLYQNGGTATINASSGTAIICRTNGNGRGFYIGNGLYNLSGALTNSSAGGILIRDVNASAAACSISGALTMASGTQSCYGIYYSGSDALTFNGSLVDSSSNAIGLYLSAGTGTVTVNCPITYNGTFFSGYVQVAAGTLSLTSSLSNTSSGYALVQTGGSVGITCTGGTAVSNSGSGYGVYVNGAGTTTINNPGNVAIYGNTAGVAFRQNSSGPVTINGNVVSNLAGVGAYNSGTPAMVVNGNVSDANGGGTYEALWTNSSGVTTLNGNVTYSGTASGGLVVNSGAGATTIINGSITDTSTGSGVALSETAGSVQVNCSSGTAILWSGVGNAGYTTYLTGGTLNVNVTGSNVALANAGTSSNAYALYQNGGTCNINASAGTAVLCTSGAGRGFFSGNGGYSITGALVTTGTGASEYTIRDANAGSTACSISGAFTPGTGSGAAGVYYSGSEALTIAGSIADSNSAAYAIYMVATAAGTVTVNCPVTYNGTSTSGLIQVNAGTLSLTSSLTNTSSGYGLVQSGGSVNINVSGGTSVTNTANGNAVNVTSGSLSILNPSGCAIASFGNGKGLNFAGAGSYTITGSLLVTSSASTAYDVYDAGTSSLSTIIGNLQNSSTAGSGINVIRNGAGLLTITGSMTGNPVGPNLATPGDYGISVGGGTVALVGSILGSGSAGGWQAVKTSSNGKFAWTPAGNAVSIPPATDVFMEATGTSTISIANLAISNSGRLCIYKDGASATVTTTGGTITNMSSSAVAAGLGFDLAPIIVPYISGVDRNAYLSMYTYSIAGVSTSGLATSAGTNNTIYGTGSYGYAGSGSVPAFVVPVPNTVKSGTPYGVSGGSVGTFYGGRH